MYKYKFPIGDWSGDGHSMCDWFVIQGAKPIEDVREAHFKCPETLGFEIGEICSEPDEWSVSPKILDKIGDAGIAKRDDLESLVKNRWNTQECAKLWVKVLNHLDPELKLSIIPEEDLPSINFYGMDSQDRHLCVPGYGLHAC